MVMVGVDMSKEWFDYRILNRYFEVLEQGRVENNPIAILAFIAEAQLWVYDRWGNLVFQSNPKGTQLCWDGSSRGRAMDVGMYYYRLRAVDVLGKAVDLQGTISLLR